MALKKIFREYQRAILGCVSVLSVFLIWELALTFLIPLNPFFFTKPSLIAIAFKEQVIQGALWGDLAVSSKAFLWGFSFAILLGIPLGALMGWRRRAGSSQASTGSSPTGHAAPSPTPATCWTPKPPSLQNER